MTTDLIHHASGFELLFILSAVVGLRYSVPNYQLAWHQFRSLGGITNGRRALAVESIAVETVFIAIHALYVIVGAVAVFIPSSGQTTAYGVLAQSVLVLASWGITLCSWVIRRTSSYLLDHGLQARDSSGRFISEK
jgi:hypothetical protein